MKRDGGVTLLEMLVALAVFGIVAAVLYESFTRTLAARAAAAERSQTFATARAAFDWLERDLKGSLSVTLYPTGSTVFSSSGHGAEDTLAADEPLLDLTVRTARRTAIVRNSEGEELASNMADQARVRYLVESASADLPDPAGVDPGVDLVRYEWRPPVDEVAAQTALRTVVARRVHSVDFRFETRGAVTDRWEQILTGGSGGGPRLVEIRIVLVEATGALAEFATSVSMPLGGRLG